MDPSMYLGESRGLSREAWKWQVSESSGVGGGCGKQKESVMRRSAWEPDALRNALQIYCSADFFLIYLFIFSERRFLTENKL